MAASGPDGGGEDDAQRQARDTSVRVWGWVPAEEPPRDQLKIARIILQDMRATVGGQAEGVDGAVWRGPVFSTVFQRPLAMDTVCRAKPIRLLELARPAGPDPPYKKVWEVLNTVDGETTQGKPVALLIGVSGVGKTRSAYDLGVRHAFAVLVRLWTGTDLSLPWAAYFQVADRVSKHFSDSTARSRLSRPDRASLFALLLVLLTSHLEWALDVSEAAAGMTAEFAEVVASAEGESEEERRVRTLREVVLRAQRNGEAEVQVRYRFARAMRVLLRRDPASESFLGFGLEEAKVFFDAVAARASVLWPGSPVLWAHDEVQALLGKGCDLGADFFDGATSSGALSAGEEPAVGADDGAWAGGIAPRGGDTGGAVGSGGGEPASVASSGGGASAGGGEPASVGSGRGVAAASVASADGGGRGASPGNRGSFYGLLAAIRYLTTWDRKSKHLLTGTYFQLSTEALASYSPAQGLCTVVPVVVNLGVDDLRQWLAYFLTPPAMEGVSDAALRKLCGRPLFATRILSAIVAECTDSREGRSPAELVQNALAVAARVVEMDMRTLVSGLLSRHTPLEEADVSPSELVMRLFYSAVVDVELRVDSMRPAVAYAVERGVLNGNPYDAVLDVGGEAPTKAAIVSEVLSRVGRVDSDPVMRALVREARSAVLPERSEKGPALEVCLVWFLIRSCLKPAWTSESRSAGYWVPLSTLLHRLHAFSASTVQMNGLFDATLLAGDEYEVLLTHGRRCDGARFLESECALRVLLEDPHAVLHHHTDAAGGPDIVFLARHRVRHEEKRLVCIQCKNRVSSTIRDALRSLDFGQMYSDTRAGETDCHRDLRRLVRTHRDWVTGAFRVVAAARGASDALLVDTAWYNENAESPVVILHLRKDNLGADIFDDPKGEQDISEDWPSPLYPSTVRHWAAPLPDDATLPPPGAAPGSAVAAPAAPAAPAADARQRRSRIASLAVTLASATATQPELCAIAEEACNRPLHRPTEITLHRTWPFQGKRVTVRFTSASECFRFRRWLSAQPQPIRGHHVTFAFA